MEITTISNQEEQAGNYDAFDENYPNSASGYNGPGDDAANQDDYPENDLDTETGADDDDDDLAGTDDEDDDLTGTDDDDDYLDETDDDEDESANDADGNGGYPGTAGAGRV